MNHRILTQRAKHLRPPTAPAIAPSGAVTLKLDECTTLDENVPIRIAPNSGSIRQTEPGEMPNADFVGYVERNHEVRQRDLFTIGDHVYLVTFVGNQGPTLRAFGAAHAIFR